MRRAVLALCAIALAAGCNQSAAPPAAPAAPAAKKLGIRPNGDTEIQPDLSQVPPELQKVFANIDENIDAHVITSRNGFASQASPIRAKAFPNPLKW